MIDIGLGGRSIGMGLGRTATAGAAAFVGAYDAIPNIVAAYGMRRLRTAYTGSLLRLRRSSDNAEQDIGYTATGDLDTAAIATFIGGGSGYIVNWYDQSGNAYTAAQATAASQPLYVASGQNGKPVWRWDGSNDFLNEVTGTALVSTAFTIVVVLKSAVNVGAYGMFLRIKTTSMEIFQAIINNGFGFPANSLNFARRTLLQMYYSDAAIANFAVYTATLTLAANDWAAWLNGSAKSLTEIGIAGGSSNATVLGVDSPAAGYFKGDMAELIICNAALSDANRQAAEAAANAYWAIY